MDFNNLKIAIEKFQKYVIQQARSNLSKQKKNYTKSTYDSLKSEQISEDGFTLVNFEMNDYGFFQDEGVNGKLKQYGSRFSFKDKMPPIKPLAEWAKKKNIRLRDDKGKFKKGNFNTIGFLIARSIFKKGIKPSLFFTKAFNMGVDRLIGKDLGIAIDKDLSILLDFKTTKRR